MGRKGTWGVVYIFRMETYSVGGGAVDMSSLEQLRLSASIILGQEMSLWGTRR